MILMWNLKFLSQNFAKAEISPIWVTASKRFLWTIERTRRWFFLLQVTVDIEEVTGLRISLENPSENRLSSPKSYKEIFKVLDFILILHFYM